MTPKTRKIWGAAATTVAGIFALRLVNTAYHKSRLRKLLRNALGGDIRKVKLNQRLVDSLPRTSLDWHGRPTEPINFIFIGTEDQFARGFTRAGWTGAVHINASNWLKAFVAGLFNRPYPNAPFTPYYIATSPQDLSLQKPTARQSIHERHHIRLWRTNLRLDNAQEIWLGMASLDKSLQIINGLRFPYHHIDAELDREREYIVRDLLAAGARELRRFSRGELRGVNDHKDNYYTDGKVVAMDLTGVVV